MAAIFQPHLVLITVLAVATPLLPFLTWDDTWLFMIRHCIIALGAILA